MPSTTQRSGFTLVELLVVIVVIGILATLGMTRHRQVREQAYLATLKADLAHLALHQELHFHANARYGDESDLVDFNASDNVTIDVTWLATSGFAATATHSALPGVVCGYQTGGAPAGSAGPATVGSQVICE